MRDEWEGIACFTRPASSPTSSAKRAWPWGGEKTWNSDSGWGCMLRTGQSLLANALVYTHLGVTSPTFFHLILTWFFDMPSPEAPFSVHRMALAGKELGTDVGQWFGPSVAAGGIRSVIIFSLTHS